MAPSDRHRRKPAIDHCSGFQVRRSEEASRAAGGVVLARAAATSGQQPAIARRSAPAIDRLVVGKLESGKGSCLAVSVSRDSSATSVSHHRVRRTRCGVTSGNAIDRRKSSTGSSRRPVGVAADGPVGRTSGSARASDHITPTLSSIYAKLTPNEAPRASDERSGCVHERPRTRAKPPIHRRVATSLIPATLGTDFASRIFPNARNRTTTGHRSRHAALLKAFPAAWKASGRRAQQHSVRYFSGAARVARSFAASPMPFQTGRDNVGAVDDCPRSHTSECSGAALAC